MSLLTDYSEAKQIYIDADLALEAYIKNLPANQAEWYKRTPEYSALNLAKELAAAAMNDVSDAYFASLI